MAKRKPKFKFFDLVERFIFYKTARGCCKNQRGTFYWLDKNPTDEVKVELENTYSNVNFCIGVQEYNPNAKSSVLFLADRGFK